MTPLASATSYVLIAILVASVIALFWRIDDWKRDWTTNHAELQANAADPQLRPVELPATPSEVADGLIASLAHRPRWTVCSRDERDGGIQLHLTRRTRLLRFVDDVHVTLAAAGEAGTRVGATSRSRIGKGDLGQNPRNLRELVEILESIAARKGACGF